MEKTNKKFKVFLYISVWVIIWGSIALIVAILSGLGFTWFALKLKIHKTNEAARSLMFASFAYLPIVQITYVLDKI